MKMYYHTLVANGPTREPIASSLTGAIWVEGKAHPEIITRSNLLDLLSRKVFLARKFRTDDIALLDDLCQIQARFECQGGIGAPRENAP